jgi:hypothetical protein
MLGLVLAAILAIIPASDDPAGAIAGSSDRAAARQCAGSLAVRAGGDLLAITVDSARRHGSRTLIAGTINIGQRPIAGPPGTLTPAHIVNIPFHYRCWLRRSHVVKTEVTPFGR